MARFKIQWTEETWFETIVEADSEDEALRFWEDNPMLNARYLGSELQDSADIEEVTE